MRTRPVLAAGAVAVAIAAAGCGSSSSSSGSQASKPNPSAPEVNPAGDIPDNQAYVRYAPPGGGFTVKVPEGWARSSSGRAVTFTDKLNAIRLETALARGPMTPGEAQRSALPRLRASIAGFRAGQVRSVSRNAGTAVRITYLADATANPVTGKRGRDAVERYVFFHKGRDVILTLSGPVGADNVDPWKLVTDSVRWTG